MDDEFDNFDDLDDGFDDMGADIIEEDISGLDSLETEENIELTDVAETDDIGEPAADDLAGLDMDESAESDPRMDMAHYMAEHNYGKEDYAEYSQDPEYQEINDRLLEKDGLDPVDYNAARDPHVDMTQYMSEHNYGKEDYAEYSQDPEYQEINDRLLEKDGLDPVDYNTIETPDTEFTEAVEETEEAPEETGSEFTDEMSDSEISEAALETEEAPEETEGEFTDEMSDSEISEAALETEEAPEETEGELTDEMPDNEFTEDVEETTETPGEENDEFSGDLSENELHEDNEETDVSVDDIPNDAENVIPDINHETDESDDGAGLPGDLSEFVDDSEFEDLVKADVPEYYESGSFYDQGINEYGFEGTCGPTSQANAINALFGTNEMTENKVLTVAVENELCETGSIDPADNGGTGTEDFMKLYEKVNEKIGDRLNVECFDYDKALSVDEMADKLDEGSVLNIAVDSATLWDQNDHIPGELAEDVCTDHWITVTGVDRDANGEVIGFNIIDSGGGESYADIEKYERMCFGESGREMIDPTCIVVSKNAPVDTGKSG